MKFVFKVDRKVTYWKQEYCEIEAESEQEFLQELSELKSHEDTGFYNIVSDEILLDTEEEMTSEENGGQSTFGIEYKGEWIYENGEEGSL